MSPAATIAQPHPDAAWQDLIDGNARFVAGRLCISVRTPPAGPNSATHNDNTPSFSGAATSMPITRRICCPPRQKQLLAIAAVLITGPDVIADDEPTTLLDLRNSRMVKCATRRGSIEWR
jgi:hypothetical protein